MGFGFKEAKRTIISLGFHNKTFLDDPCLAGLLVVGWIFSHGETTIVRTFPLMTRSLGPHHFPRPAKS